MSETEKISRRDIFKAAAVGAAGIAISGTLVGCASSPLDQINKANEEIINQLDLTQTRLPVGSVVETDMGRFMIAGQIARWMRDGYVGDTSIYDYYGVRWPGGFMTVRSEVLSAAVFNIEDINKVLFIGYTNDEDREYREYIQNWDVLSDDGVIKGEDGPLPIVETSSMVEEQNYRMAGKRSEELYGDRGNEFYGGLLYADLAESDE